MEQTRQHKTAKVILTAVLTFVVTLAMVVGLMPGMSMAAYADGGEITACGQSVTISSDQNCTSVTVFDEATLTVNQGVTLTLNISDGYSFALFDNSTLQLHGTLAGSVGSGAMWMDNTYINVYLSDGAKYTVTGLTCMDGDNYLRYYGYDAATDGNGTVTVKNGTTDVTSESMGYKTTTYTFTATPASGYHFVNWTKGAGGEVLGTDASINVTCEQNGQYQVYANFEEDTPAHTHDFTYSVHGATITATCNADGCTLDDGTEQHKHAVTLTIVKPTLTTYGQTGEGISASATLTGLTDFNTATGLNVQTSSIAYWNAKIQEGVYKTDGDQPLTATPTSAGNYLAKITVNNCIAAVGYTINKADPTYTVPTDLNATYGDTLADVALPTGWAWADNTANVGNAGTNTFKANFTPADTANYNTVNNVDVTVTVVKADPTYTLPSGLTATYGDTLSSVTLPEGWTWTEPTTSVGTVGSHTFAAIFTPDNTDNYNSVKENLTVTVNANDKSALIAAIGSASEYYNSISVDYPEIAATLQEAINVATAVKDDENKTVTEISDAVTALNGAVEQAKVDENQAKADAVKALITAIGTVEYTTESKAKIDEARTAYNGLTDVQKALVDNYTTLTTAETTYATEKKTADDNDAANAVKEKIAAIGTVEYNTESKGKINEAREAYDALTADQKALVDTYETLTTAESTYATLKADNDAADATKALVDAIGMVELTVNSKAVIDLARESYDGLTPEQKALVTNYDILTAAEARYADLGAADEVKTLIDTIGDVAYSTESKGKIDAAREAYDALSAKQKALVTNYETLAAAEVSYTDLKVAKEAEDAINALPASDDITVNDKANVQAAQAKYDALTPAQKEMVSATVVAKLAAAGNMVAAQEVIVSIGDIDASNPDSAKVTAARVAYDALSAEQKAKVTNYDILTAAENKLVENNNPEKQGLSGGAIAGIVIAFVVVLSAIGLLVFSYLKQRKNEKK